MAEIRFSVTEQDFDHAAGACAICGSWQLRTLVAYLFDGRECEEVRRLLANGSGLAHGTEVSWQPMELSVAELSAIESTFPKAMPDRVLHLDEVRLAVIRASRGEWRNVGAHEPAAIEAASRAKYLYFDYGSWVDLYEAAMTDGAVIRYEVPRAGIVPPWSTE